MLAAVEGNCEYLAGTSSVLPLQLWGISSVSELLRHGATTIGSIGCGPSRH